jgi:hypothetical protein
MPRASLLLAALALTAAGCGGDGRRAGVALADVGGGEFWELRASCALETVEVDFRRGDVRVSSDDGPVARAALDQVAVECAEAKRVPVDDETTPYPDVGLEGPRSAPARLTCRVGRTLEVSVNPVWSAAGEVVGSALRLATPDRRVLVAGSVKRELGTERVWSRLWLDRSRCATS